MNSGIEKREKSSIIIYVVITFAITWSLLAIAIVSSQANPASSSAGLITLATLGPILGAVMSTRIESGRKGIRSLLAQVRHWRFQPVWYGIVLCGPALVVLAAVMLSVALGGIQLPTAPASAWLSVPMVFVVMAVA